VARCFVTKVDVAVVERATVDDPERDDASGVDGLGEVVARESLVVETLAGVVVDEPEVVVTRRCAVRVGHRCQSLP
jgi:hypothetical protein